MTLVVLGLAWILGLTPVAAWGSPWWMGAAWTAAASAIVLPRKWSRPNAIMALSCVALASVAGLRLAMSFDDEPPEWRNLVGSEVTLTGVINSEPDRKRVTTGYTVRPKTINGEIATGGEVLVQFHQYIDFLPGDRVTLRGELEPPPVFDTFNYRAYLEQHGIYGTMFRPRITESSPAAWSLQRWLTARRLSLDAALQRSLPEPESSLAGGIAFGRDDGLSREALEAYNRAGLRHLVAVSGSNVSLVTSLTYLVAIPLVGRRRAWLPAAITILMYLGAAGFSGSVVRAGFMAGILLLGGIIGRPQSGLPALFTTVIGMTAWRPELAVDTGFQLSTTATAGLITLAPWISRWLMATTARLPWFGTPRLACQVSGLTLAASICTAPISWYTFGEISVVSPVANLLVEPVFTFAFWASLATAVVTLVSPDAGTLLGVASYYPLALIGRCAEYFGSLPVATAGSPAHSVEFALAAYVPLTAAALVAYRYLAPRTPEPRPVTLRRERSGRLILAAGAGAALVAAISIGLTTPGDGGLVVQFLDVGQGDAALLTTPHGRQMLIDGGPSALDLSRELGATLPHWDRSLDAVLLSHPDEDHIGGLPKVFDRYRVGMVYDGGFPSASPAYRRFAAQDEARQRRLVAGDSFELDGVRFDVLWPPAGYSTEDLNNTSLVIRVTFDGVTLLFPGDAEALVLERLEGVAANILKVPHHGSKTTPPAFLSRVGAQVAVVSVGATNTFGHPHPDTLAALGESRVFRTDEDGRVRVRVRNGRVTTRSER